MQLNAIRKLAMDYHGDQKYAGQPYIVHLDMVQLEAEENKSLLMNENDQKYNLPINFWEEINQLCYLHDSLEDTEITEYQLSQDTSSSVAKKAVALSINHAKHIDDYFNQIGKDMVTSYVKLCDRLANVKFGLKNPGPISDKLLNKYRNEQPILKNHLIHHTSLLPMLEKLDFLLKEK